MLRSYEAIYNGDQFRWVNQIPPKPETEIRVLLVMEINTIKPKYQQNIHEIFEKAWGCFGNKSLDEIDKEMNEMRQEWDREWD